MSEEIPLSESWIRGSPINFHLSIPVSIIQRFALSTLTEEEVRQIWDELYSVLCQWAEEPENKEDALSPKSDDEDESLEPWDNFRCRRSPVLLLSILISGEYLPLMELMARRPVKLLYGVMAIRFAELSSGEGLVAQAVPQSQPYSHDRFGTWALASAFNCQMYHGVEIQNKVDNSAKNVVKTVIDGFTDDLAELERKRDGEKRGRIKSEEVRRSKKQVKDARIYRLAQEVWPDLGPSSTKDDVADEILARWVDMYGIYSKKPSKSYITTYLINKKDPIFKK